MSGQAGFVGLRVLALESRRADEMRRQIERCGGRAIVAPSMREVPLEDNTHLLDAAERLTSGAYDTFVCLTGVGTRAFLQAAEAKFDRGRLIESLRKTALVARGPKPVAALRENRLQPTVTVDEPNTWRELVAAMTEHDVLRDKRVAVQEYGVPNPKLIAAMEEAGGQVDSIPVYAWALPEDPAPLNDAIEKLIAGDIDVALFTSAQQFRHLLQVAETRGRADAVREAFRRVVVGSIGPVCTETLGDEGVDPDHEPDRTHMTALVRDLARLGRMLLERKRFTADAGVDTNTYRRVDVRWPEPVKAAEPETLASSAFLRACRREPTDYTPIWIMRQAGRFMREYREFRARVSFLELCKTPEYAAEVTLMAVDRLGVDAAIVFSDILLILEPMGVGLEYVKGDGPKIARPVRESKDVDALSEVDAAESLGFVYDAVRMTRSALAPTVPLIGFAGAPFTLASYLIEGRGSRNYENTKTLMYRDAGAWHAVMERITRPLIEYLNGQIDAGAQVVQLFDSWVGALSPADYRQFVLPHSKAVIDGVRSGTPVIHFGTGTATLLELIRDAGGDVIGLDWRIGLDEGWARIGHDRAVQGNLDPTALYGTTAYIKEQVQTILNQADGRPGHIFNLGHGVLPTTPYDNVVDLVDMVHELSAR